MNLFSLTRRQLLQAGGILSVSAMLPHAVLASVLTDAAFPVRERSVRSEKRRLGKACRSRWTP